MASRKILEISKGPYKVKVFYDKSSFVGYVELYRNRLKHWWASHTINGNRQDVELLAGNVLRQACEKMV